MSELNQEKQNIRPSHDQFVSILVIIAFLFLIYFIQIDRSHIFDNYPTASAYFTDFLAGFMGIAIAFSMERRHEKKLEKEYSRRVISNIIQELESNKKRLKEYKETQSKSRFVLLTTSSWDMFKEKIVFKELDNYIILGKIYHLTDEFNSNLKYCGNLDQAEQRMNPNPKMFYYDLIQMIDEFIISLEQEAPSQ